MIIKTKFKDLFIFKNKSFKDKRGYFKELVKEKISSGVVYTEDIEMGITRKMLKQYNEKKQL